MKKILIALTAWLVSLGCLAQENNYLATVWGAKSDGITDNTASLQRAIDFISAHGGGTLSIYVGRYITGAIQLKDNVTLYLGEGAVLVASTNYYDYNGAPALIWSKDARNVAIKGKGVIECRHFFVFWRVVICHLDFFLLLTNSGFFQKSSAIFSN